MGGVYGTTSAYYKVKGAWLDATGEDYYSGGWIVNNKPCQGSITMTYKAIQENYYNTNSGKIMGTIRCIDKNGERIGSGDNDRISGFIEYFIKSTDNTSLTEKLGNPITFRYDSNEQTRTLPSGVTGKYYGKGYCASSTLVDAYKNYKYDYFGIGWYYGNYTCDLTNVCIYDDDYNDLGISFDGDVPKDNTYALYGVEGERIYVTGFNEQLEGLSASNDGNTYELDSFKDEGKTFLASCVEIFALGIATMNLRDLFTSCFTG